MDTPVSWKYPPPLIYCDCMLVYLQCIYFQQPNTISICSSETDLVRYLKISCGKKIIVFKLSQEMIYHRGTSRPSWNEDEYKHSMKSHVNINTSGKCIMILQNLFEMTIENYIMMKDENDSCYEYKSTRRSFFFLYYYYYFNHLFGPVSRFCILFSTIPFFLSTNINIYIYI
jgi:hypothetical protein